GFDPDYAFSLAGPPPDLVTDLERGVADLRVGTSPDLLVPAPDPAVRVAYGATLDRLTTLGAIVERVAMPHHELLFGVTTAVFGIEGGAQTRALIGDRPRIFSPATE